MDLRRAYFEKDFRKKNFDRNLYQTPINLFEKLNKEFGFKYDLAANEYNTLCDNFFDEKSNSLEKDWHKLKGFLWLNPPYKPLRAWIEKAQKEAELGAKVVMLVPPLVNNHYFVNRLPEEIRFFKGRINFFFGDNEIKGNMFDSCLLIFEKGRRRKISWVTSELKEVWSTR